MSEIDAKREARRRRILENSERRLQNITGRNNGHTEPADRGSVSSSTLVDTLNVQDGNCEQPLNGTVTGNHKTINRQADTNILESDNLWNGVPSVSNIFERNNSTERNENIHTTVRKRFNSERHADYDGVHRDHLDESVNINTHAQITTKTPLSYVLMTHRMNYVVLAIIVNALLILRLDHLFGKTITIPYFTLLLGHLYAFESTQDSKEGSLLVAALILCNVKPELIHMIKRILRVVSITISNLALYIFSFTLIHYVIFNCLYDTDILFASNS